jgi:hypothetical protein
VNVQQAKTCLRLLSGYWPHPELTEDEVRVWMRQLAGCEDHRLAATVIDTMAESAQFRPNAGQFASIYRARTPRCREFVPGGGGAELPETTENLTTDEWRARVKEQLANMHGPITKSLRELGGLS